MGDSFIGVAAVAAVRRMLGIKPVQMKIQFCMSGSEMKDGALISSVLAMCVAGKQRDDASITKEARKA